MIAAAALNILHEPGNFITRPRVFWVRRRQVRGPMIDAPEGQGHRQAGGQLTAGISD
jgi:hypothetical protein